MIVACGCFPGSSPIPRPNLSVDSQQVDGNTLRPSAVVTPFPATHPQDSAVTPFAATHTNSPSCKSFPCHTYKKQGLSPLGVRRSCSRFHNRHPRAQSTISSRRCDITSFLLASQPHLTQELLKWIPPSSPAPETPSTPPNSANSLSPTVASAACSATNPTHPSAWSTPAKSNNSSRKKKSARNS